MRKIYVPLCGDKYDDKYSVESFIENADEKIRNKFIFCINHLLDESRPLAGPYIKHFSIPKYKMFYEICISAAKKNVRIIFYKTGNSIYLLYAFYKTDSKDVDPALKMADRIFKKISHNGYIKAECRREADFGD